MRISLALKLYLLAAVWTPGHDAVESRSDDSPPLTAVVDNLVRVVERQGQQIAALQATAGRTVAFCAYISDEPSIPAALGNAIPFHGIITNVGGGYNSASSAFTAPHPGYYFFMVHADCSTDYHSIAVNVNGHAFFRCDNDQGDGHVTGSGLVTLKAGDVVIATHTASYGAVDAGRESTFTGFLVK